MAKLRASMGMVDLSLPGDGELHQAAGRFALAHGQLELMLRMTIKTLSGMAVKEALNATEKTKNWELRAEILKLFKRKTSDPALVLRLKALLGACEQLSEQRNRILHNAWGIAPDGSVVMKGGMHAWGAAPTAADLDQLTEEITNVVSALNTARLRGFIHDVCRPKQKGQAQSAQSEA